MSNKKSQGIDLYLGRFVREMRLENMK